MAFGDLRNKYRKNIDMSSCENKGVDFRQVPQRVLRDGSKMPAIGLGTFGSDSVSAEDVAKAVYGAAQVGYRHFDCASVYGNEDKIGEVFQKLISGGISREDMFVTSKVWNDMHKPEDVKKSCKKSLSDLKLDYLDMYLVHWPFPNFHPPKCDVNSRSKDARPYIHSEFMETWSAMEDLYKEGLVRHIGTSNMTEAKMELLLRDAKVKPFVNEMELHPHFQQKKFYEYLKSKGIEIIGYCPIGSPGRPERDRTAEDTCDIQDEVLVEVARRHNIHPAALCVKWAVQRGHTPIPFSTNPKNYTANIMSLFSEPLSDDEMLAISNVDKNCRLIKGQVFLWKENQSWEDLWDLDSKIAE